MKNYLKHKLRTKKPIVIVGWVILGITAAIVFAALFGFVIMWLWNWLMPELFGLSIISYWQAVGLLILSKILFGGLGCGNSGSSSSKDKSNCRNENSKVDFSKWQLYDKYWEEEGDEAYKSYTERASNVDNSDNKNSL